MAVNEGASGVNHVPPPRRAYIGSPSNFWLHSSKNGFDLTHPPSLREPEIGPRLRLETSTSPITISPAKTALIIIDMQNFFLSSAFARPRGTGHRVVDNLLAYAIPAARKAGIQIIWVNWGITAEELENMPPAVTRAFGFQTIEEGDWQEEEPFNKEKPHSQTADKFGSNAIRPGKKYGGLGTWCGQLEMEDGSVVDAGNLLMRDSWNARLYPPLEEEYKTGLTQEMLPDLWVHKNRMSGLWGGQSELQKVLEARGIKSLLFTGINTDQCVAGTFLDAFSLGYDCVMLEDCCATTSPEFAQQNLRYNAANTFGFELSCERFANGVDRMEGGYVMVAQ